MRWAIYHCSQMTKVFIIFLKIMFKKVMYSTVTFQYIQKFVGKQDEPWVKSKGLINGRDVFHLTLSGLPKTFATDFEETCFNLVVGVLPSSHQPSQKSPDFTGCASSQHNY